MHHTHLHIFILINIMDIKSVTLLPTRTCWRMSKIQVYTNKFDKEKSSQLRVSPFTNSAQDTIIVFSLLLFLGWNTHCCIPMILKTEVDETQPKSLIHKNDNDDKVLLHYMISVTWVIECNSIWKILFIMRCLLLHLWCFVSCCVTKWYLFVYRRSLAYCPIYEFL